MTRALTLAMIAAALTGLASSSIALPVTYTAFLNGANEAPPNLSPGTGFTTVVIDVVAHTLYVDVSFQDLLGTTTAAHIHAATALPGTGTAGVATQTPTFTQFPLGVSSGTYTHTFDTLDLATWNPSFVTGHGGTAAGAEAFFASSLAAGTAYLNVHSNLYPAGEIRGFLQPVPEPASLSLLALGGLGMLLARRRKAV